MATLQLPRVRVPIPVVIPLCLGVVGGVWWFGTRDRDFMTPPSERELALIRQKVSGSLPVASLPDDVIEEKEPTKPESAPVIPPKPDARPGLADYRDEAVKDAASLASLARQLETQGDIQRALLAWERILDSTAPDEARTTEAIQAIKRLRPALPDWNVDPAAEVAITIHAGTGETTATMLAPVIADLAREIEQASSGILKITTIVSVGHDIPEHRGPAPIALWLAGPDAESHSTEVFAFTIETPETFHDEVAKTLFILIRNFLGSTVSLTVPEAITPEADPMEVMRTHVTRLGWLELGSQLNKTP